MLNSKRLLYILLLIVFSTSSTGLPANNICQRALQIIPKNTSEDLRDVLYDFAEISKIFRPTFKETKIRRFLMKRATKSRLASSFDEAGNVVIKIPGTGRFAGKKLASIALQSHMDMVLKTAKPLSGVALEKVFKHGVPDLELYHGWIRSKGSSSTIGADNGMGMAIMLRYMDHPKLEHPPLSLIFTASEEKGLMGASRFKIPENIGAIINLDEERFGKLSNGCQGSCSIRIVQHLAQEPIPKNSSHFRFSLGGLAGGHSGTEIHRDLQNAVKLGADFLTKLINKYPLALITKIEAGTFETYNVIPKDFMADIVVPNQKAGSVADFVRDFQAEMRERFRGKDGQNVSVKISPLQAPPGFSRIAASSGDMQQLLKTLNDVRVGVLIKAPGLTHNMDLTANLAFFKLSLTKDRLFAATYGIMPRAFRQESLDQFVSDQVQQIYRSSLPTEVYYPDDFPAWVPKDSWLIDLFNVTARSQISHPFHVWSVPGGLETAQFFVQRPDIPMISVGPTIKGAHDEKERVRIDTVGAILKILDQVLINIGLSPEFQRTPLQL